MSNLRIILILTVLILFVVFMAQNTDVITVKFLFLENEMSSVLLILISGLAGFIFGLFVTKPIHWRRKKAPDKEKSTVEEASAAE